MKRFFAWCLCLLTITPLLHAQDFLDLSYNFKAGQQYQLTQKSRTESYLTVQDILQRSTRDFQDVLQIDITEAIPGKATLTMHYTELKFTFNARNQNITVDAKIDNEKEPFQAAIKNLLNHPFSVELQSFGLVKSITGLDEMVDSATTAAFGSLKAEEKDAYTRLIKEQFGAKAFQAWLEQLLVIYPAHGIKTGTQWTESLPLRSTLKGDLNFYWNLQTWDNETAKIGGTGKINTDKLEDIQLEDGYTASAAITGNLQSDYLITLSSGLPAIAVQNTELNGNYTYRANKSKGLKKDLQVPVKIITNASYKIKQMK
ncbi:hypothetical protein GA0116948_102395 [Chitinophaga costaii]|uniref:Uncharacterized protein n=1 Tax=Chitinophaga costaii TaxID=1335309 RepID=A0A1C4B2K4_9BACT|nr:DUF6263 family protein [Chitinophaga costaii]PUZ26843.1 hypothetical protein DCM91_10655 [Chitinophaga costaii]SCC01086.1 hypothetical protein GA0116948_102395 [Chitinophaga costaii]